MRAGAGGGGFGWSDVYSAQGQTWRKWMGRAAVGVLIIDVCGFLIVGANRPANPHLVPPTTQAVQSGSQAQAAAPLTKFGWSPSR